MKPKLKYIFIFLPTFTVLIGLYVLKNVIITILFYHIGIILILMLSKRITLYKEIIKGWNIYAGLFFIIGASSVGFVLYFLWNLIYKNDLNFKNILNTFGLNNYNWLIFILYFSFVNPVFEELFWRAYFNDNKIFNFFEIQDFGFAVYHLLVLVFFVKFLWLFLIFIFLYIAAVIYRYIYLKFGGLIIPILSHITADICIILVVSLKR